MTDIEELIARITADAKGIKAEIKVIKKELKDTGKEAKEIGKGFDTLSTSLKDLAANKALYGLQNMLKVVVSETTKLNNSMLGLNSVAKSFNVDTTKAKDAAKKLADDGLAPVSVYANALKNLLSTGIGLDQAIELIERYKDRAAFGRSETISFSQAIEYLSQSFRTEQSEIADLSGQTENYSVILQEGLRIMQERGQTHAKNIEQLTQAERVEAKYLGTIKLAQPYIGNAIQFTEQFSGKQERLNTKWTEAKQELGEALIPVLDELIDKIIPIIENLTDFISEHEELIAGLTTGIFTFTGLISVLTVFVTTINSVRAVIAGLQIVLAGLGIAMGPTGWLVLGMSILIPTFTAFASGMSIAQKELESNEVKAEKLRSKLVELNTIISNSHTSTADLTSAKTELKTVLEQLRDIMPEVIEQYEKEGKSLDWLNGKLREHTEASLDDLRAQLAKVQAEKAEVQAWIRENGPDPSGAMDMNLWAITEKEKELQGLINQLEVQIAVGQTPNEIMRRKSATANENAISSRTTTEVEEVEPGGSYETTKSIEDIQREQYQASLRWIQYKKDLDQMSEEEEIAALNRLLDRYKNNTDIRRELEVRIYQLKKGIAQEEIELQKQLVQETLEARRQAEQELLKEASDVNQKYKKIIEDQKKAELEAIDVKREAIRDAYEDEREEIDYTTDKAVNSIQKQIDALDQSIEESEYLDSKQDRNDEIVELEDELQKYLNATSKAGIEKRKEIEDQIGELRKQQEREDKREAVEEQKRELNEEIDRLREQANERKRVLEIEYEDNLDALNKDKELIEMHYNEVLGIFSVYSDSTQSIEETLKNARIAIQNETNEEILNNLQSFVDEYQRIQSEILSNEGTDENSVDYWNKRILEAKQDWWEAYVNGDSEAMKRGAERANEYRRNGGDIASGELTSVDIAWLRRLGRESEIPSGYVPRYHSGGIAGIMHFSNPNYLMPNEIRAVLKYGEPTFTKDQFASLLSTVSKSKETAEHQPILLKFGDVYLNGDKAEYERFWRTGADIIDRQLRSKGGRKG